MAQIPTQEPTRFYSGDSVQWRRSFEGFPSSTWFLSYVFTGKQFKSEPFKGTPEADGGWLITITPAESKKVLAGDYTWVAYVEDDGATPTQRFTQLHGTTEVLPDLPNIAGAYDARSHAQKMVEALEAMLEGKATHDQMEYTIAGRSLKRMDWSELIEAYNFYRQRVRDQLTQEAADRGETTGGKLVPRFLND